MRPAPESLAQYCPDLEEWPRRWGYEESDWPPGEAMVEFFKPFLLHLLEQDLARKTLHRHRDNLWLLGGEWIRRRYDDPKLKKMPVAKAIDELVDEEGGPLIFPTITETEQNEFDATCRKLYKFLNAARKPAR